MSPARTSASLSRRRAGEGARLRPPLLSAAPTATSPQHVRVRVRGGYEPAMLVALAGRPLSITFRREETAACSERVVFPSLGRSAHLPPFQDVTLDLLPLEPGEHEFTCQLGVLRGRLVATVDGRPPPRRAWRDPGGVEGAPAAALRRLASGRAETVVLGLVAWLCSLPLLLLLVVPIVGWRVAGTVSVAWLATLLLVCFAICLTRLPRKGRPPPGTPPSGANP